MRYPPFALVIAAAAAFGCSLAPASASEQPEPALFDAAWAKHWQDGRAELSGYALKHPRYGQLREGRAVTIVVTEPFAPDARVKADRVGADSIPVLKLNLVQDFQTGVYDYNLLTSAFVSTAAALGRPAGSPVKVSFSAQEWCGHVYAQVLFDAHGLRVDSHSYFEGEADQQRTLAYPEPALSEDVLLLWARGLAAPRLQPGERRTLPLLRSLERVRLGHSPLQWDSVTLERGKQPRPLRVPAGSFSTERHTALIVRKDTGQAERWQFFVEPAAPHRLIAWESDDGTRAELRGEKRLAYWQLNAEGDERQLHELGF